MARLKCDDPQCEHTFQVCNINEVKILAIGFPDCRFQKSVNITSGHSINLVFLEEQDAKWLLHALASEIEELELGNEKVRED